MALEHLLTARLVELGKVKCGCLGDERTSGSGGKYRMPVKLDHWIITTLNRDAGGQLIVDTELMAALKEYADADGKLRRIPIRVMSNNLDEVMTCNYVAYAGKKLAAKSDGETLTEYQDRPGGKFLESPKELPHDDAAIGRWKMKKFTTLNMMIDSPAARFGGVYKFRTTSEISGNQLYGSFKKIREDLGFILKGVPLYLAIRPMQVTPPPDHKATTIYVAHVEIHGSDILAIQTQVMNRLRADLSNVKEVRALEMQMRALIAHVDEPDDEELVTLSPPPVEQEPTQDAVFTPVEQPAGTTVQDHPPAFYADNVAEFLNLLIRKGFDLAGTIVSINNKFKTRYAKNARWDTIDPEHLVYAAEQLLKRPDAEKGA